MDNLIEQILEKVRLGELTDSEAEKQYLELSGKQALDETIENSSVIEAPVIKPESKVIAASQHKNRYTKRKIECIKKVIAPEYRVLVFLPFGFGNDTVSWSWKNSFEDRQDVEVWLIGASEIVEWPQLINYLVEHMLSLSDMPFIVYGHSMGGIVAYEVLAELEKEYQLTPIVFIPSSVAPPAIFERLKVLPPLYDIDDEMDMLDCRRLLEQSQIILPVKSGIKPMTDAALRSDIQLLKTYQHTEQRLSCPIIALQANNDILVKDSVTVSLWKQYTSNDFMFQEVEGTHLYFMNPPQSFFRMMKSLLCKTKQQDPIQFKPKTYRLISFESGTEEVSVYPYGTRPKGYLIYQPDGKMAAHLWNATRRINDATKCSDKDQAVETMLTYLAYSGDFLVQQGVIEHTVQVSTDPNFVNDNLIRYFQLQDNTITLNTAPLTTKNSRQSKSSVYSQLKWEEVDNDAIYEEHPLIGSWKLDIYRVNGKDKMGNSPSGLLILTEQGYFSLLVMKQHRNRPCYDNIILASDQEIQEALNSSFSNCGRFEITGKNSISLLIEEGLSDGSNKQKTMQYQLSGQELTFKWTEQCSETGQIHTVIETWTKA